VKTAVIILGHGSKSKGADDVVQRIAAEVKKLGSYEIVEYAFLQYVQPTPHEALERCIRQKAERIVIVPFFMHSGTHVTRDVPELVEKAKKQHPGIDVIVTDYAGEHPLMAKIVVDLVDKTE
jgi:sirohydrochlorin ferrochelatase